MRPDEYSEAEVQQIIARAAQLDTSAPDRLRVDQLRAIATELGISPAALDRALQEHASTMAVQRSDGPTPPAPRRSRWHRQRRGVTLLVAGVLLALSSWFAMRTLAPREQPADVQIEIGGR